LLLILILTVSTRIQNIHSECTYSHFEQSSQCPICTKSLSESDFTELVVADATSGTNDIAKTSLQTLFTKQSKSSHGSKALPLSDLCFSLVRQIDVVKQSTKFLLKQLLMNSNSHGRKVHHVLRINEKLKNDITHLKQGQSSQRLQYQQVNTDLNNKLAARETSIQEMNKKLAEKDRMLDQFRRLHGGNEGQYQSSVSEERRAPRMNMTEHQHDHASISHRHQIAASGPLMQRHSSSTSTSDPPLKGLMMQRQKQHAAQQQVFNRRRGPNMSSSASIQSSITGIGGGGAIRRGIGDGMGPVVTRPFSSSHSTGSNSLSSVTPRVRDLSHGAGFNFSGRSVGSGGRGGGAGSGGSGGQRLNKRRRTDATPMANHAMSPNTAFTLNHGSHSVNRGQQRWNSGNFSR
jgi:hypothetical protein